MFKKVLIANRGEIALRVIKSLKKLGVSSVAVYSDADRFSPHVLQADESYHLGGAKAKDSYLNADKIIEAAKTVGAEAVHPGYGFLSENPDFVEACEAAGIVFMGPTAQQMVMFGLKHKARELAKNADLPLLEGSELLESLEQAKRVAEGIGYPVMLKSTAGGGGIGMIICRDVTELESKYESVIQLSKNNFSNSGIFLEKYVENARHIEVQVFGDGKGKVITLGERDCSTQRRNQKVIEETPAPHLRESVRAALLDASIKLASSASYRSAGTVEYIYDADSEAFYFLEMNTRLQVEHGVTELVTGADLVEWMIRLAAGEDAVWMHQAYVSVGASIQVRVYAEDPYKDFQPSSGLLTSVQLPEGARCDHWLQNGLDVSPNYDPLLAKIMVYGEDRSEAIAKMEAALADTSLAGIETNLDYLSQIIACDDFKQGLITTKFLKTFDYRPATIDVTFAGTMTTVQDYPGRIGYWDVGIPPSGPMDELSFRLGNAILGNAESAPGLECLLVGPTLTFNTDTEICLTGAVSSAKLNGGDLAFGKTIKVARGDQLEVGKTADSGARTYLCIKGGLSVPAYLGSASTFTLGKFGGHGGRALMPGDVLKVAKPSDHTPSEPVSIETLPELTRNWSIEVLMGPHCAPDFFTEKDIDVFLETEWEVHFNSARTGVRLIGPKPEWARTDGGEAGLHPSNIHDNAYAIGAVDFTGDMPVILGPDGPSLGGFVCPVTVIKAELWKLGQLKPGDTLQFVPVSIEYANAKLKQVDAYVAGECSHFEIDKKQIETQTDPVTHVLAVLKGNQAIQDRVMIRQSGDDNVLVEFGDLVLDIELRFKVHVLQHLIEEEKVEGILELTPGIRSLQVHFNNRILSQDEVLDLIESRISRMEGNDALEVPSRIVHLPLSWDDPSTRLAIDKYVQGVRRDAPWCPDNIEFIRRINGLANRDAVKEIVYSANYLVMGLGDVYLGAPVATPLDPRHRLVTTKYNPARTWTPENAVGIGGAYLCVYGMEGPGGYQFVGRTVQMWNKFLENSYFEKPWLLRFFDQIKFYEVDQAMLQDARDDFLYGKYPIKIEATTFSLQQYQAFLKEEETSITAFKTKQQTAFDEEYQRWVDAGLHVFNEDLGATEDSDEKEFADQIKVVASVPGSIWRLNVNEGDTVTSGQVVAVLESMKMEIAIEAPVGGEVSKILSEEGAAISQGKTLMYIK